MSTYQCQGRTRSIYLHWPFCPYKCHFCPFVALASHDEFMGQYHESLKKEIVTFCQKREKSLAIDTIYMGGGTPSTYPEPLLLDLFGILKESFDVGESAEITIEVNPGTVPPGRLEVWKQAGINRLSIGVQSLNDKVLQGLNRLQTKQQVEQLLERACGLFDNVSVDLILGLPGVSEKEWKRTVEWVTAWPLSHVSVYFLTVHEDTPLYFKVRSRQVSLLRDERMVALYHWTCETLARRGLVQYELSNFARAGHESRHNTVYWDRKPYKGFGLGACSFDGITRLRNEKNLVRYLEATREGRDAMIFSEQLSSDQVLLERLMLSLRQTKGVTRDALVAGLGDVRASRVKDEVETLVKDGFLSELDNTVRLTPAGLVVENEIIARLHGAK